MVDIFKVSYTVFKEAATRYPVFHFPTPNEDGYVLGTGHSEVVYTTTITNSISAADVSDFIANLLPDSEASELEGDVIARPTLSTTGNLLIQYDLSDPNYIYIGKAVAGTSTSVTGWTIVRYALDADGNTTDKTSTKAGTATWDDRALESYS